MISRFILILGALGALGALTITTPTPAKPAEANYNIGESMTGSIRCTAWLSETREDAHGQAYKHLTCITLPAGAPPRPAPVCDHVWNFYVYPNGTAGWELDPVEWWEDDPTRADDPAGFGFEEHESLRKVHAAIWLHRMTCAGRF